MSLINKDFRSATPNDRQPRHRWLLLGLGTAVALCAAVVIASTTSVSHKPADTLTTSETLSNHQASSTSTDATTQNQPAAPSRIAHQNIKLPLPELQAQQQVLDQTNKVAPQQWQEYKVKSGDSLARIFQREHIKPQQLDAMMKSGDAAKTLLKLYPKDTLRILTDDAGDLQALRYEIDTGSYLLVERDAQNQLTSTIHNYDIEVRHRYAQGVVDSSLFEAANAAGISDNVTMELANIFGWDIDFALDIRKGDSFSLLYEQIYRNGEKISDGHILAADFTSNGKTYSAVRYEKPGDTQAAYYSPDGTSMRKAFLRAPVDFTRISSRFSTGRYHPILHRVRRHEGVDYAAKRGTPIRAAGDGKIVFKGIKGGYGRVIIIQHGSKYSTLYAHMNSFDKHVWLGKKVKQGQYIGYVGSSGLATGPHLHYEFRVNGVHRNPLTVKLPSAQPIVAQYRDDFLQKTRPVLAQLDLLTRTQLALNQ
jgi:murein DD-endopeptidase MepM/ murein hydrolase activator NlpD